MSQSDRNALLGGTIAALVVTEAAHGNVPAIAATAQIAGSVVDEERGFDFFWNLFD